MENIKTYFFIENKIIYSIYLYYLIKIIKSQILDIKKFK